MNLSNLISLNASSNLLKSLPPMGNLIQLNQLQLNCNQLTSVPESIALLPLSLLDLSNNLLQVIPDLHSMKFLGKLCLTNNQLQRLPLLPSSLRDLEVAENKLTSISTSAISFPQLERLDLRQNALKYIEFPIQAPNLKDLCLSFNHLLNLDNILNYSQSLVSLDVQNNQLNVVPSQVFSLNESLKRLDVRNNNIGILPSELGFIPLFSLLFEGNMIKNIPRNLKTQEVLKVLRERMGT
jgi:Leucine-rich repeat (LRR) protein